MTPKEQAAAIILLRNWLTHMQEIDHEVIALLEVGQLLRDTRQFLQLVEGN